MRFPSCGAPCALRAATALVALSILACADAGKGRGREGDSAVAVEATASTTPTQSAPATDDGCPKEGDWALCSVEDRLLHAGLVVERREEPVRHDFLSVAGIAYKVGGRDDEVQVFIYPTSAERKRESDALDSATASPKGRRVSWGAPPTLVTSNNLVAIILSLNDRTVERLALALGAGLPQPQGKQD